MMPALTLSLNAVILNFLAQEYGGQPHAPKRLARVTAASPRTAENWLHGLNAPTGERLADLLAEHPDLEAAVQSHIRERRALREQSALIVARARARQAARA